MVNVTDHAIHPYRERVAPLTDDEIVANLSTRAIEAAAQFGHCKVVLPSGHRVVVNGGAVITIVPPRTKRHRYDPR